MCDCYTREYYYYVCHASFRKNRLNRPIYIYIYIMGIIIFILLRTEKRRSRDTNNIIPGKKVQIMTGLDR